MEIRTAQQFRLGPSHMDTAADTSREHDAKIAQLAKSLQESADRQRDAIQKGDALRIDLEATYIASTAQRLSAQAVAAASDHESDHGVWWSLRPFIAFKGAPTEGGAA